MKSSHEPSLHEVPFLRKMKEPDAYEDAVLATNSIKTAASKDESIHQVSVFYHREEAENPASSLLTVSSQK